jgi:hypothetical protein
MPWTKFKSHKEVEATKIVGVQRNSPTEVVLLIDTGEGNGAVEAFAPTEPGMALRVDVGDYAIRYPDGFRSVSPAKQFEEGYSKVDEQPAQG